MFTGGNSPVKHQDIKMYSRSGAQTKSMYKVFKDPSAVKTSAHSIVKDMMKPRVSPKQSYSVINQDGSRSLVIPGLQEELEKINKIYKHDKSRQEKSSKKIEPVPTDSTKVTAPENATKGDVSQKKIIREKNSRDVTPEKGKESINRHSPSQHAMLIQEQFDRQKILPPQKKQNKSSSFQAIGRSHSTVTQRYYGPESGTSPGPGAYRPDYTKTKPLPPNATINVKLVSARVKPELQDKSNCQAQDHGLPCNYDTRRAFKSKSTLDPVKEKKTLNQRELEKQLQSIDRLPGDHSLDSTLSNESLTQSQQQARTHKLAARQKQSKQQLIYLAQEEARRKIHSLDFNRVTGRGSNSILAGRSQPVDARFENLHHNIEAISGHRKTTAAPLIGAYSGRTVDNWKKLKPQPDTDNSKKVKALGKESSVASLNFGKRGGHMTPTKKQPFKIPDGYDSSKIERGFELSTNIKRPKAHLQMDKMPARDNTMYNFDPQYVKDLKREHRKAHFNLSDYLPHSLKKDRQLKTDQSQSNYSKLACDHSLSHIGRQSHKNHASKSSLGGSNLNSLAARERNELPPIDTASSKNYPNYASEMKKLRTKMSGASFEERSQSLQSAALAAIEHQSPANVNQMLDQQLQVETLPGSFLFYDSSKNRLGNLGKHHNTQRVNQRLAKQLMKVTPLKR